MSVFAKAREAIALALDTAEAKVAALAADGRDAADAALLKAQEAASKAKEALAGLTDVDTE